MKKQKITLLALLVAIFTTTVNATDYFVKTDGNDANDGLTWATAKLTIASVGDMNSIVTQSIDNVYVAGGTYTIAATMKPKSGVNVYGGYNATTGVRDLVANESIINGAGNRILQQSSSGPVLTASTTWDGFTITGGNKTSEGGGVSISHATASYFTLNNCKITGNIGSKGGGINAAGCKISNCIIENNIGTTSAGGLFAYDGSGTIIENCIIRNNKVTAAGDANAGGGGVIVGGTTVMNNCLIYNNESLTVAGGLDVQKQGKVFNTTVVNNKAPNSGGVRVGYNASAGGVITFQNNIVWNNSTASQIIAPTASTQNMVTNAFDAGGSSGQLVLNVSNTDVAGPNFVNPTSIIGSTQVAGEITTINTTNLSMKAASPCVDAGTLTDAPITSFNGIARPKGFTTDMGAYENTSRYFVKTDGLDTNDGLSWSTAKLTIASVGDMNSTVTQSGDNVYVAGGTYTIAAVMKPKSGVNVYGGYNATTGVRDLVNNESIINGAGNRILQQSSSGPVLAAATTWDGFTITGGNKTSEGGGVSISHATASFFTLNNCKITGNTGSKGGGINAAGCKISNCIIENNIGTISGGGLYAYDGSGTIIENCIIRNNKVTAAGDANAGGGGVIVGGTTVMNNCLIYNNESLTVAGGLDVQKQGKVFNTTVVNNKAPNSGGVRVGYNASAGGVITFQNNIVWNNSTASQIIAPTASTQNMVTNAFDAGGNSGSLVLNADNASAASPKFVGPTAIIGQSSVVEDIAIINATNLHLAPSSPCVNVGTTADAPTTAFDGVARPQGSAYDLGAYETDNLSTSIISTGAKEVLSFYPNPVKDFMIVNVADIVSVKAFDVAGRNISIPFSNSRVDVSALENGIYIIVVESNNQKISGRLVKQ